jgi:hypothetical protein
MPVSEFKSQVLQWLQRKEGMGIAVVNRKQSDLPAWAFPEGCNPLAPAAAKAEEQEVKQEVRACALGGRRAGLIRGPGLLDS